MDENNTSTNSSTSGGSKKGLIIAVVAVIVILAIAGGGFLFLNSNKQNSATEMTAGENTENADMTATSPAPTDDASASASGSTGEFRDGTYEAVGTYSYHAGTESISVSITLKDGKVEDVVVKGNAKAPTSKMMQEDFIANFKTLVVGKDITEVKLGKVSGSSLTPIGFNAAVEDIKTQAQES